MTDRWPRSASWSEGDLARAGDQLDRVLLLEPGLGDGEGDRRRSCLSDGGIR